MSSTSYGPLVEVSLTATFLFLILSAAIHHRPIYINALLLITVSLALITYSILIDKGPIELFIHLYDIVIQPEMTRKCLLIFWLMNVLASIAFGMIVSLQSNSSTIHRKFFHLTISLIYTSGLFLDVDFLWLCGYLLLCIFVIIEILRYHSVPPWGEYLNDYLLVFKDSQDSSVLLTPLFLLVGIFIPLFFSIGSPSPRLYQLAGVASVGVGDSFAAIVGSKYGKHKWPGKSKTVEGSIAMGVGIAIFLLSARLFCIPPLPSVFSCIIVAIILSAVEAFVKNIDNLLLPIVAFLLL